MSGWIKVMNALRSNPKVVPISDGAFRLYIDALCWCNEHLTDGTIPDPMLGVLAPGLRAKPARAAEELVSARLWERLDNGWLVHDYLEAQTSASKVAENKRKAAERMAAARASEQNGGVR